MSAKLVDRLVSALIGAASAVGTVWYLSVAEKKNDDPDAPPTKIARLEVGELQIDGALALVDPATKEPTLELRDGALYAQNGVFSEQIGAYRFLGQKLQVTPGDPLNARSPIFSELATNEDGGAYLALLSPQESHAVTIGFDKSEKGCVVSQNTQDSAMVAQAIFLKPSAEDAAKPAPIPATDAPQDGGVSDAPTAPPAALEPAPAQTGVVPAVRTAPTGVVPAVSTIPDAIAPAQNRSGVVPASTTAPSSTVVPAQARSGVGFADSPRLDRPASTGGVAAPNFSGALGEPRP